MNYTLYGDKKSGAFSAEAVLAEVGVPYDFCTKWMPTQFCRRVEATHRMLSRHGCLHRLLSE